MVMAGGPARALAHPVRGAIIGVGNVAVHGHVPGWRARPDVEIVAATDVRPSQHAICAAALPAVRWYRSAERLLDEASLDFVDICTPPSSHAPIIEAAMRRRLHVLCEKPLVRDLGELCRVTAAAASSGRVLHTVHNWHHAPVIALATRLLRDGAIGPASKVTWQTLRTRPSVAGDGADNWRLDPDVAGGGILTDHGWHVIYVLDRWLAAWPTEICARLETRRHMSAPVEDTAVLTLTYPAASAEVLLTWAADERRNWVAIEGPLGRIELQDDTVVLIRDGAEQRWSCPPLSGSSHHPDWFGAVVDEFLAQVSSDAPAPNLREATLCATVESLARESNRQGSAVLAVPRQAAAAAASVHPEPCA